MNLCIYPFNKIAALDVILTFSDKEEFRKDGTALEWEREEGRESEKNKYPKLLC